MYCTASFFPAVPRARCYRAGAFLFLLGRPGNVSTCGLRPFPALLLYTRFQMRIAACPIPPHAAAPPHGACIPQTRVPQARPSAKADTRTGPVSQTVRHGLAYGRKFRFPTPCAGGLRGAPASFPGCALARIVRRTLQGVGVTIPHHPRNHLQFFAGARKFVIAASSAAM